MRKLVVLSSFILLSGCASYHAATLAALNPQFVKNAEEIKGLSIGCKCFNREDCKIYLDRDVLAQGYQPIQLTFYNQSDKNYLFSTAKMSLPCVQPEEVAKKVHTSTVGRVVGYTVGALLLHPLIIPAVVDGICSHKANQKLDSDYYRKAESQFMIPPLAFKTAIIFVPRSQFSPAFNITLWEEDTQTDKTIQLISFQ